MWDRNKYALRKHFPSAPPTLASKFRTRRREDILKRFNAPKLH
jgi:hypothetical protein